MSSRDKSQKTYQIGEVARIVNLTPRTIRYYEEIGLLNSIRRIEAGRRVYTDDDIRRLKFIKRLKLLGLSLAEMLELESIYQKTKSNAQVLPKLIDLLDEHAKKVDDRIRQLQQLKREIIDYRKRMESKLEEELKKERGRERSCEKSS
ncbi:MAG: MerR family transcriptional regulator [Deltaproteobacteria bacterium]|nr:MAG: MerR family transcriptional regulator [Deltaproteobacteria bacterium]